jgi:hypothetical protein
LESDEAAIAKFVMQAEAKRLTGADIPVEVQTAASGSLSAQSGHRARSIGR